MGSTHWQVPHLLVVEAIQVSQDYRGYNTVWKIEKLLVDFIVIMYKRCSFMVSLTLCIIW